jgi:hypothetical protein
MFTIVMLMIAGQMWAADINLGAGTVNDGSLKFYSSEACTDEISEAATGATVYIKASPNSGYTGIGLTMTAECYVNSAVAQARRRAGGSLEVATVAVSAVTGKPGIYMMTLPTDAYEIVKVSTSFVVAATQSVSYVDENYQTRTASAIVLDETMATLDATKVYVVPDGLTINHDIGCVSSSCALTIIVPDGKTLSLNTVEISDDQGLFANAGFHMDCSLSFYGQTNATGKVVIHTKKEGIGMNGALIVAHLNMEAACSAENAIKAAGGVVFAGHQTKGNSLTVRSAGTGYSAAITGGGNPVTIKNSDVEVTGYAKSNGEYVGCSGSGILGGGTTGVTITGLADGSNTVKIRSNKNDSNFAGIYCASAPVTISNCDVDIVHQGHSETKGIFGGKGVTITGLASGNKVNKLTVRSDGYGITTSSSLISISNCDVEVTGITKNDAGEYNPTDREGITTNSYGINITGRVDGSNKVVVRSNGYGCIYAGGCPLNIKYCDVDVFTNGRYAYAIFAGGTSGVNIEGVATGNKVNKITVRSYSNGIYGGGGNVSISYCDVEVTNTTKNADGDYDFCRNYGINAASGSTGVTMIGRADGSNKVTVRSVDNAIYGAGQPVTIKYYDVEVFSNGSGVRSDGYDVYLEGVATGNKVNKITVHSDNSSYGGSIYSGGKSNTIKYYDVEVTGAIKNDAGEYNPCGNVGLQANGNGLILIGRDNVGNKISVRSNSNALNASGTFIDIKNYDVDVVSTNSYGLLGTSDDGLSIASTLENGNTIKVKSGGPGLFSSGTGLNITNCTVDVESVRTAIVASHHTASNTDINTNINIIDSKLTVTCTGVYEGSYASEYCGIIAPAGLTIDGSQVTVSAPKGYAGIYAYKDGSTTIADELKYVTFSWKNASDFIMVDSYQLEEGYTLNIAEGKVFKYTSGNTVNRLMGIVTDLDAIANKELTPYGVGGYCGKDDETTTTVDESKNVTWEIPFVKDNSGNTVLGSILAINGTGAMADYTHYSTSSPDNFAPWIEPDHTYSYYLSGGLKYPSVTAVTIGSGVTTIGDDAFHNCDGLTDVTIGTDVTTLGAGAFQLCDDVKDVTFAKGSQLTTIGNFAFGDCISLTTIDIPDGVTTIGKGAFSYCSGLTAITIPDGVTAIDMNTFMFCSNLSDVTIGSGVATIGANTFEKCTSLTAITIPANVTTIYEYAFVNCPSLETVTIERYDSNTATNGGNPITTIDSSTFVECDALKLILVPSEDAYDAYNKADDGWTGDINDDGTGKTYKSMLAPSKIELTKSASGWSTYCHNYPVSYSLSDGNSGNDAPKAYTLSGLSSDGKSVDITAATDNHVAPATPLLLGYKAPANNNDLLTLTAVPATATTPATSVIVDNGGTDVVFYGNTGNTALDATALTGGTTTYIYLFGNTEGRQSYVLSQGKFIPVISTDGGIAPHRCWLNVKGTAAARELSIGDGETTGIAAMEDAGSKVSDAWYSLDGRKFNAVPTRQGVYVNGGRKVVIK